MDESSSTSASPTSTCISQDDHKHDLPLMANSHQVLLHHFALDLHCDLEAKAMSGYILMWLDNTVPEENKGVKTKHVFSLQEFYTVLNKTLQKQQGSVTQNCGKSSASEYTQGSPVQEAYVSSDDAIHGLDAVQNKMTPGKLRTVSQVHSKHCSTLSTPDSLMVGDESRHLPEVSTPDYAGNEFRLVLDCCDLEISNVEEVLPAQDISGDGKFRDTNIEVQHAPSDLPAKFVQYRTAKTSPLKFAVEKWCLRVWKTGVTNQELFPKLAKVTYKTIPSGTSLRWAVDQDGR